MARKGVKTPDLSVARWVQTQQTALNQASSSDILFQNTDGQAAIWELNGANVVGGGPVGPASGPSWLATPDLSVVRWVQTQQWARAETTCLAKTAQSPHSTVVPCTFGVAATKDELIEQRFPLNLELGTKMVARAGPYISRKFLPTKDGGVRFCTLRARPQVSKFILYRGAPGVIWKARRGEVSVAIGEFGPRIGDARD